MLTKQTYTMKCRETGYTAKVNVIEVDDVPGHIIGVGEFPGVLSCDDGSVATTSTKDMFDYIKGSGKFHGYNVATFEDGVISLMHKVSRRRNPRGKREDQQVGGHV